jgi:hypothetical protein
VEEDAARKYPFFLGEKEWEGREKNANSIGIFWSVTHVLNF